MLFVQLQDQIFHKHELLDSYVVKQLYGEEFFEEGFELIQFVILPNSLFTAYKLVYPLVVLFPFWVLFLEFVPNTLQGGNIHLHFIAEFVDKSK